MAGSNFVDYVKIYCRSGDGGSGSVHFRREKYIPKGGPDGGDGGKGGDIIMVGNVQMWTLLHLRYTRHLRAKHGASGSGQRSTGGDGDDIIIQVPLGTIAKDPETGAVLGEMIEDGQGLVLLKGGRGGQGNVHFKTATNQAPQYAQPGEDGIESSIVFELKILADVGLVGFPNAGKSTLLSVVSAAKPEIADEGKGLGLRFLRHIERNSILLFLVPADSDNITKEYQILLNELGQYNPELLDKDRILAISKSDMLDEELVDEIKKDLPEVPYVFISSVANMGLMKLKDLIWSALVGEAE